MYLKFNTKHIWTLHCFSSNKDYTDCFWKFGDSQTSCNYSSSLQNTPQVKCGLFLSWYFAVVFSLFPPPPPPLFSIQFPEATYIRCMHIKLVLRSIRPYTYMCTPVNTSTENLEKRFLFYFPKMTDKFFALYWFMLVWIVEVSPLLVNHLMASLIFPLFVNTNTVDSLLTDTSIRWTPL